MSLKEYKRKRNFKRTPEPAGVVARPHSALRYVIQKHDASRLHYDFRLEYNGVLKSWAVPKGPSLDPGKKSLAVQVEDHPVEYGDFEGVIPKGEYGGGTVLLWDTGTWHPIDDPKAGLRNGRMRFELNGAKLHGEWSLVRMHGRNGGDGKNWLLIKNRDQYANSGKDILADAPKSVKSNRELAQIADNRDAVWDSASKKVAKIVGAANSNFPSRISPQLAVLAEAAPAGNEWLHEIKFDGYRILAFIKAGKVRLLTRNGNDWTAKFPGIAKSLESIKADSVVLDGEAVVLDADGRSDFQSLQAMLKDEAKVTPVYYAFDLLFLNGFDLRDASLIDRKSQLEKLLKYKSIDHLIRYSDHVIGNGDEVAAKACGMSLEGVVSKRVDSRYISRRDPSWLKSKCAQRQEFVVIGYTRPQGSRTGFGSLLLGVHDEQKRLVYAGRVGTGFDTALLTDTTKELKKLEQPNSPTDVPPPARERKHAHWVKPKLVAEVRFTGWTRDQVLRHPAFIAFRTDKPASQIVREKPVAVSKRLKASPRPNRAEASKSSSKRSGASQSSAEASVAGVRISHPGKVLDPSSGVTKLDVAEYYDAAREWMLPHVADRPLALVRCPEGLVSKCFFQRNWSNTLPASIGKVKVGIGSKTETHVMLTDIGGIISLAQIGVMEIHTWNCRSNDVDAPDQLVLDLDPGPGVTWKQIVSGARAIRKMLDSLKLPSFIKTSGGKGLHITIPIRPNIDWESAKQFTGAIAKNAVNQSDQFVANMRKDLRGGKIYIDFNRNGRGATAVGPYSTRARAGVGVSMPISWEELGLLKSADHFTVEKARRYLEKRKSDPWSDFVQSRVDLHKALALIDPA